VSFITIQIPCIISSFRSAHFYLLHSYCYERAIIKRNKSFIFHIDLLINSKMNGIKTFLLAVNGEICVKSELLLNIINVTVETSKQNRL